MSPRFVFALFGFMVVAAFIEDYDRDHGTGYLWPYIILIWLIYLTAHRAAFAAELQKLTSIWRDLGG